MHIYECNGLMHIYECNGLMQTLVEIVVLCKGQCTKLPSVGWREYLFSPTFKISIAIRKVKISNSCKMLKASPPGNLSHTEGEYLNNMKIDSNSTYFLEALAVPWMVSSVVTRSGHRCLPHSPESNAWSISYEYAS